MWYYLSGGGGVMKLSRMTEHLNCDFMGKDLKITGLKYDSRLVKPGDLFFAVPGFKVDGHDYVVKAIENGAVAVVVESVQKIDPSITQIVVQDSREALGIMATTFYGFPSQNLRMIGVTGTNGKTTTTYLIKAILEEAGYKVGLIGTNQNLICDQVIPSKRTTPESLDLQHLLAEMVMAEVDYVVMEVSSHALELKRTVGVEYDVAVFTNLTQDHLDFHKDFSHYFAAKAKLFNKLNYQATKKRKTAIINLDDPYGLQMMANSGAPVYSYGVEQFTQINGTDLEIGGKGLSFRLVTPCGGVQLDLNLTGKFNIYNSLAACACCLAEGVSLRQIKAGLQGVSGVTGRFELVDQGQNFTVIVDYAHTPDGMENVLTTAKSFADNKVICVFGAGGDRDRRKRPLMGEVAARYSNYIIITSDNPRSEDPQLIAKEIEKGILAVAPEFNYDVIVNRGKAIKQAIRSAEPGDVIIICGKGHETYQEFKDEIIDFDDRQVATAALKELLN